MATEWDAVIRADLWTAGTFPLLACDGIMFLARVTVKEMRRGILSSQLSLLVFTSPLPSAGTSAAVQVHHLNAK